MTYISNKITSICAKTSDKIRVILIDDSNVVLSIFQRVLLSNGQIEIVGTANSACDALQLMDRVTADIILLDIEMPNRTGLDALPDIIAKADGAKVIIVSAFVDSSGPSAIKALSLGACDTLAKPGKVGVTGDFSKSLIDTVIRLGRNNADNHAQANPTNILPKIEIPEAIFIGASTGGIPAIQEFLENLSDTIVAPIFVAQHLPDAFISYFARQLALMSGRQVVSVNENTKIRDGNIYLAASSGHLAINLVNRAKYVTCLDEYVGSHYTPSVDALFHSAAKFYGAKSLSLLMSGMGQDGADGARSLFEKNAQVWAQDQNSSVVWGMPGSIVNDGTSSAQLKPIDMARAINAALAS